MTNNLDDIPPKYSRIFQERFAFECGSGWYEIIDQLCHKLETIATQEDLDCKIMQIKEKYGFLRVYTTPSIDEMYKAIENTEQLSKKTCEVCGDQGKLSKIGHWMCVRCPKCREKRAKIN